MLLGILFSFLTRASGLWLSVALFSGTSLPRDIHPRSVPSPCESGAVYVHLHCAHVPHLLLRVHSSAIHRVCFHDGVCRVAQELAGVALLAVTTRNVERVMRGNNHRGRSGMDAHFSFHRVIVRRLLPVDVPRKVSTPEVHRNKQKEAGQKNALSRCDDRALSCGDERASSCCDERALKCWEES